MLNALILFSALAIAEEPTAPVVEEKPVVEETVETVEEKAEEVAPIPTEKVEEIESAKEPVEEKTEETAKEEETAEKVVVEDPKVAEDYNQAVEQVTMLVKAIQSKNWPVVGGIALMLLVFVANKFGLKDKVGAKAIPWVSLLIGVFATTGMALASGVDVMSAIIQGLSAGLAAVGSWETLFKHILGGSAPVESAE